MNILKKMLDMASSLWRDLGEQSFVLWGSAFSGRVPKRKLLEEYRNIVYSCITVIAEEVGKYDPIFYTLQSDGKKKRSQSANSQAFLNLFKNPNNGMGQFELLEAIQSYMELCGEAFIYLSIGELTERPKAIEALIRPDNIGVIPDGRGNALGYIYYRDDGLQVPLDPKEIIHIKTFNPYDPYRGLGTVQAGFLYIATEQETAKFQYNFLKNHASPSGVLTLKGGIGKEAFQKLKRQWQETHGGSENAGKTLIIREAESTFTKVGLSLNDLDLEKLSKINDEKIRKMFRVPLPLLGQTDSAGLGRGNVEAIEYIFLKRTIEPKLVRLDDALTAAYQSYYGNIATGEFIEHTSQVPDDILTHIQEFNLGVDRWLTRNEIREEKGLPPIKGGETLYVPFNMTPINSIQIETPPTGKSIESHTHDHNHGKKKNKSHNTLNKAQAHFFGVLDKIEEHNAKSYKGGLQFLLDEQEKKVTDIVDSLHLDKKKNVVFDGATFSMEFSKEEVSLNLLQSLLQAFVQSGKATLESLGKPDEDFILQQAQRDAIFNSTDRLMKSFNEETALKLQQQLAQAHANRESKDDIMARVESIFAEAKGYRAERIAQTESHKAVNEANAAVYKEQGYTKLVWKANPTACEFCKAMDGQIADIGTPFLARGASIKGSDGGEFVNDYSDVSYADLHPNCTCHLVPA